MSDQLSPITRQSRESSACIVLANRPCGNLAPCARAAKYNPNAINRSFTQSIEGGCPVFQLPFQYPLPKKPPVSPRMLFAVTAGWAAFIVKIIAVRAGGEAWQKAGKAGKAAASGWRRLMMLRSRKRAKVWRRCSTSFLARTTQQCTRQRLGNELTWKGSSQAHALVHPPRRG